MAINNNTLTIGAVLLLVVAVIFGTTFSGGGNGNAVNVWEDSANLQDNTLNSDEDLNAYEEKDGALKDLVNETQTKYNVSKDENGDYIYIDLTTNQTQTITDNAQKTIIDLSRTQEIKNAWINENYDVGGFIKYYEAFLIYDNAWNKYILFYRIDNEKFIIKNLDKYNLDDLTRNDELLLTLGLDSMFNAKEIYFRSNADVNDLTIENLANFVVIDGLNNVNVVTNYKYYSGNCAGYSRKTVTQEYISNVLFSNVKTVYSGGATHSCGHSLRSNVYFGVTEFKDYSFDSVAINSNTRSIGFDKVTLVKQELNDGDSSFPEKSFKIVSENDFNQIVDTNSNLLSVFMKDRIKNSLVTQNLNNELLNNNESYLLSDDINGVVVENGYAQTSDLVAGEVIVVTQAKFNPNENNGLTFSDLGYSSLTAPQIDAVNFGNLKANFELQTHGNAYFVEPSLWDQALGVVWNVLTFDFDGVSQFWTNSAINPYLQDNTQAGNVAGDNFGFISSVRNSAIDSLRFTNSKPLTTLLEYNGANYWLFYTLETQSGEEGCMVIDYLNTNLNERLPAVICSDIVAGSNSVSQFKISSN